MQPLSNGYKTGEYSVLYTPFTAAAAAKKGQKGVKRGKK